MKNRTQKIPKNCTSTLGVHLTSKKAMTRERASKRRLLSQSKREVKNKRKRMRENDYSSQLRFRSE
jgi:hypothetical protein